MSGGDADGKFLTGGDAVGKLLNCGDAVGKLLTGKGADGKLLTGDVVKSASPDISNYICSFHNYDIDFYAYTTLN